MISEFYQSQKMEPGQNWEFESKEFCLFMWTVATSENSLLGQTEFPSMVQTPNPVNVPKTEKNIEIMAVELLTE